MVICTQWFQVQWSPIWVEVDICVKEFVAVVVSHTTVLPPATIVPLVSPPAFFRLSVSNKVAH